MDQNQTFEHHIQETWENWTDRAQEFELQCHACDFWVWIILYLFFLIHYTRSFRMKWAKGIANTICILDYHSRHIYCEKINYNLKAQLLIGLFLLHRKCEGLGSILHFWFVLRFILVWRDCFGFCMNITVSLYGNYSYCIF